MSQTKKKRIRRPKGWEKVKIGDSACWQRSKSFEFGTIVALDFRRQEVTIKLVNYRYVWDLPMRCIVLPHQYKAKHHAALLGVKP